MKYIICILAVVLLSYILGLFLPWWSIVIAPFLCGIYFKKIKNSAHALLGFVSAGLYWGLCASIIQSGIDSTLPEKIGELFSGISPSVLLVITAFMGGIYGGISEWAGSLLIKSITK